MMIMTKDGYKPLVSYEAYWAEKRQRIEDARKVFQDAMALPRGDEQQERMRHGRITVAFRRLDAAYDAYMG